MAYFVLVQPTNEDSFHTPIWFRLGSTNSGSTSFRYVVDTYVGGNLISRQKVMPDSTFAGIVDVAPIIRSFVSNYFALNPLGTPVYIDTNGIAVDYTIKFGEEYVTGGVLTTFTNLVTTNYTAWNAYNLETPTTGFPFKPTYGLAQSWLTSRDLNTIWISRTQNAFISILNSASPAENYKLDLRYIDEDNNPIAISGVTGASTNSLAPSGKLQVINLGVAALNASGLWNSPPTPVVPATAAGYSLRIIHPTTPTTFSSYIYVKFLCEAKAKATALHFLNRFGGYDTFYFTGPARRAVEVESKTFQRIPLVNGGSYLAEYTALANTFAETTTAFNTRHTWTRKLISGYLNDVNFQWLSELIASSVIYLEENGYYFPVAIADKKWSQKLTRFDKMYNLELSVIMGRQVFSQNR